MPPTMWYHKRWSWRRSGGRPGTIAKWEKTALPFFNPLKSSLFGRGGQQSATASLRQALAIPGGEGGVGEKWPQGQDGSVEGSVALCLDFSRVSQRNWLVEGSELKVLPNLSSRSGCYIVYESRSSKKRDNLNRNVCGRGG